MRTDGLSLTVIVPNSKYGFINEEKPNLNITYKISDDHIRKIAELSGFCTQYVW